MSLSASTSTVATTSSASFAISPAGLPVGIFGEYAVRGDHAPEGNHGAGQRAVRRGDGGAGREPDGFDVFDGV